MAKQNKLQIKLYEPNDVQKEMLYILHVLKPKIALFDISRQVGKTYGMGNDGLYYCMDNPKSKVLWISPTYENNARVFKELYDLFDEHTEIRDLLFTNIKFKEQEFHLTNGSTLIFRSAEQGNTLRGRHADRIYVDEAAFIAENIITEILMPMLMTTQGQMILISTPNGRNWFYHWFKKGQETNPEYNSSEIVSLKRNYLDLNNEEVSKFVEGQKKILSSTHFRREYLAEFITDDTLFLNVDECIQKEEIEIEENAQLFIGVDIGVSSDFTVITVIDNKNNVVYIDKFNMREDGLSHKEFKDRIMQTYKEFFPNLVAMYIEENNMELLIDELYDEYDDTFKMFTLSMQHDLKGKIIGHLRFLFDKKNISIPNNDTLIAELYGYHSKRTMSGKIQFQNKGVDHDDHVMSLGIACWAVQEELGSGFIESY